MRQPSLHILFQTGKRTSHGTFSSQQCSASESVQRHVSIENSTMHYRSRYAASHKHKASRMIEDQAQLLYKCTNTLVNVISALRPSLTSSFIQPKPNLMSRTRSTTPAPSTIITKMSPYLEPLLHVKIPPRKKDQEQ